MSGAVPPPAARPLERAARVPVCVCVRLRALLGRVGRAGLPGAFWCASPFPLAPLSFCFAWPPPGWGCSPLSRCCCRSSLPWRFVLVVFFFSRLPVPGSPCARARFVSPAWPLAARWWLLPRPPPLLCPAVFVAPAWCLGVFFFPRSSFSVRPRCLRLSLVSGPGCPGPRRLRCLLCWPAASRLSVRLSLFRAFRLAVGCSLVVAVLRCGGAALVCRGVLLCCALSRGVLRPVPCPALPCCPAVLCWLAVLCGCLRCWCLLFLLSSFPLLKTPAVFPCLSKLVCFLRGCGCTYLKNRRKIS